MLHVARMGLSIFQENGEINKVDFGFLVEGIYCMVKKMSKGLKVQGG